MPWTLLVSPFLPRAASDSFLGGRGATSDLYPTLFAALGWLALFGVIVWEPLYHLAQQFRWEKDWPMLFGLITVVPEAILVWWVLDGEPPATGSTFVVHAVSTWIVMWLVANGPIRIFLLRWRFRGGRVFDGAAW